jgi:hypothetical protein
MQATQRTANSKVRAALQPHCGCLHNAPWITALHLDGRVSTGRKFGQWGWKKRRPGGMSQSLSVLLSFVLGVGITPATGAVSSMKLEQSVCGLKEPFMFWLWSTAAGRPNAGRLTGLHGVEDVSLSTKDRRMLRGYRLEAPPNRGASAPEGYLLVLQGNAMLAGPDHWTVHSLCRQWV